jgi:hypothetical protein
VHLGEEQRILVEQAAQCGGGGKLLVDDPAADFVGERGVAEDVFVGGEDAGFLVPNLLLHLMLQRAKLGCRFVAGSLVIGQLGSDFGLFQALRLGIDEDLVDAVRGADGHSRGYRDALAHDGANVPVWGL